MNEPELITQAKQGQHGPVAERLARMWQAAQDQAAELQEALQDFVPDPKAPVPPPVAGKKSRK